MAKFAENRKLYGSNSRPVKAGKTSVVEVLNIVAQNSGVVITPRKSELREAGGQIIPRKLKPMSEMLTVEEMEMYKQLCALADQA
jgi:hypothetical protein